MTENDLPDVTILETLCMSCMKNGTTKLLLTTIPHFREVIISSFQCPHCGNSNREVQSGTPLAELGCRIQLSVQHPEDLNRQIIKSDTAVLTIPEIEFEIPASTQKGVCNTLEGILRDAAEALSVLQDERRLINEDIATKIESTIDLLKLYAFGEKLPFTIILDDPAGNSFIEYGGSLTSDHQIKIQKYKRSKEQLHAMGYFEEGAEILSEPVSEIIIQNSTSPDDLQTSVHHSSINNVSEIGTHVPNQLKAAGWDLSLTIEDNIARISKQKELTPDDEEGIVFHVECPHCGKMGSNEMCQIEVPGFRSCLIMAFNCLHCGSRSNEVKAMGAYGEKAKKWRLKVVSLDDLNRDVLKSDTASVSIPELDFEMCMGTLGGVFTTVEGLLTKVADHLTNAGEIFVGDSSEMKRKAIYSKLIEDLRSGDRHFFQHKISKAIDMIVYFSFLQLATDQTRLPFTLIIDDPADLSMISEIHPNHEIVPSTTKQIDNLSVDKNLTIETYDRTAEQNDELGLTFMKTENYETD